MKQPPASQALGETPPAVVTPSLPRSRWWRIMPMIFITYSLAYLDRANYGLAAAAGMARDLHITDAKSSLIGSLFLLGYFVFQVPGAIYAERYSVRRLIIVSMLIWGACSTLTGVIQNFYGLLVVRFVTGVAEAAVMPAMLIYISRWFIRSERSMANTLFILGNPVTVLWMSVLSGYLIAIFNWRWMFILEGLPAVIWAFVAWLPATDQPDEASWITLAEKQILAKTLSTEVTTTIAVRNYRTMFRSPGLLLLGLQYACWSAGVFGFVLWLPSILIHGKSMGIVRTGWLAAAPYTVAIAAMLAVSYRAKRATHPRSYICSCLLVSALAFGGLIILHEADYWFSYTLLIIAGASMYAPYGPYWAMVADLLPKNIVGGAMALINCMGALGGFVGSYLIGYLNATTGGLKASYLLLTSAMVVAALIIRMFSLPSLPTLSRPSAEQAA